MSDAARPADRGEILDAMEREFSGWGDPAARLRQALAQDELTLYLQPIVALADMRMEWAELLVRLREEESLLLPPGEFLPVFEHFGMMAALDRWVLERGLGLLARGRLAGFRRASVNVSTQALLDESFPADVGRLLGGLGVPADAVIFEIDEGDLLVRLEAVAYAATRLRRLGCRIAIDGFGRRAVSFAPLKAVQVDFLKVDGSITRNLLRSEVALRKLQAILRVGQALGLAAVAEYVEEAEIVARLRALGVPYAQGFGLARPFPAEAAMRSR